MNKFTVAETSATSQLLLAALALTETYAHPSDREAATIALLLCALELAGGSYFLKPQTEAA